MSYSRTRSRQKSRRRARRWMYVNLLLLVAVLAAGGWYVADAMRSDGQRPGAGPGNAGASPGHSVQPSAPQPSATDGPEPTPSDEPDAIAPDEGTPAPGDATVSLAFVGDILPASRVGELMEKKGVDYPFALAKDVLRQADLVAGNLEAPITARGTPAENKQFVFKGKPAYLKGVKNAGFHVLSLANNHTLDQGWEGLRDTMDALDDVGLQHMGSGADDKEAFTPAILEHGGIRVAYIGVSNVVPDVSWKADRNHPGVAETYDTTRTVAAIKAAKEVADLVVVMVHWGKEREDRPIDKQTSVGHTLIDAGADLVIGSHPHVLQGFEAYKGKWIAYSLGNFIFTTPAQPSKTQETGVLTAKCSAKGACALQFVPMYSTDSQPAPMEPVSAKLLLSRLSELSYGAEIDENGVISVAR